MVFIYVCIYLAIPWWPVELPQPGVESVPPCNVGVWSLNHWTIREILFLNF